MEIDQHNLEAIMTLSETHPESTVVNIIIINPGLRFFLPIPERTSVCVQNMEVTRATHSPLTRIRFQQMRQPAAPAAAS